MHVFRYIVLLLYASLWMEPSEGRNYGLESSSYEDRYSFPSLGTYNFMVVVTSKAGVCAGTIISREWVLSAAHCFYFRDKPLGPGDARIIAGITNYEYPSAQTKQETMSKEIHIHPSFRYNVPSKYDVALVRLKESFEYTPYVGFLAVAGDMWPQDPGGVWCMALGYGGYVSTAPVSSDLKVWNMTAEHGDDACPCALQFQAKRLVCVKEQVGPLMCHGDDGGPLVCGGVVRGIVHMVWNRVACDEASYPTPKCVRSPDHAISSYMFLCPVADWMHSIVDVIPPKPPSCGSPSLLTITFMPLLIIFIFLAL